MNERLSLEEFLAINEEYNKCKKSIERKESVGTALGALFVLLMAAILTLTLLFALNVILIVIEILVLVVVPIFFVNRERKEKQRLNDLASNLYKEYLLKNNFL